MTSSCWSNSGTDTRAGARWANSKTCQSCSNKICFLSTVNNVKSWKLIKLLHRSFYGMGLGKLPPSHTKLTPTIAIMNLTNRQSEMPDIFLASLCEAVLATNTEVWFPDWFSANLQRITVFWVYVSQIYCLIHNMILYTSRPTILLLEEALLCLW